MDNDDQGVGLPTTYKGRGKRVPTSESVEYIGEPDVAPVPTVASALGGLGLTSAQHATLVSELESRGLTVKGAAARRPMEVFAALQAALKVDTSVIINALNEHHSATKE